jgi:hypothetical protein
MHHQDSDEEQEIPRLEDACRDARRRRPHEMVSRRRPAAYFR